VAEVEKARLVLAGEIAAVWSNWRFRLAIPALVASVVIITTLGCARHLTESLGADRPSVLLITIDTIRADHCSTYGYRRLTTPTLSRVAEAGVLFQNAYAPMATTGPSHATMLTSLYPRSHGVVKNGFILDRRAQTLPEVFREAGYETAAIVSSFPLHGKFGLDQGFDRYDDEFEGHGGAPKPRKWEGMVIESHFDQDARVTTDKALQWLGSQRRDGQPFFLWVHYFDPHGPYRPLDSYRNLFLATEAGEPPLDSLEHKVAMYDAEIRETDDSLGRLLNVVGELSLSETTVLVIVGDHGEGLMQHGHMAHGLHIYEEAVRVPFVISWPGHLPTGLEIGEPVQLLDLSPTVLEIAGIEGSMPDGQGLSLAGIITGRQEPDPDRPVFLQRRHYKRRDSGKRRARGQKIGIRVGSWKYIEADEEETRELFDLTRDTLECTNVISSHPEIAARLSQRISRWMHATPRLFPSRDSVVSEDDAKKLEAMGYAQ
jgi:arylsulfatase A-like enzyme